VTSVFSRAAAGLVLAARLAAAQTGAAPSKTFYTGHDGVVAAEFLGISAGLSLLDRKIAKNFRDTNYFHVRMGYKVDSFFTHINESTLTVGGLGVWALARLARQRTVADVSFHVAESVAAASLSAQVIRGPLGRTRPIDTEVPFENQYEFHFMRGFTHFAQRSFPSIHAGSGFAAAEAIVQEVKQRDPDAFWYVAIPAYTMAAMPGLSRMYLGQHWASDIVAGAFVGTFYGRRVVSYSHSHPQTPIDRFFLGKSNATFGWSTAF
jgi:membrane-associated phospholipid phosphatase